MLPLRVLLCETGNCETDVYQWKSALKALAEVEVATCRGCPGEASAAGQPTCRPRVRLSRRLTCLHIVTSDGTGGGDG